MLAVLAPPLLALSRPGAMLFLGGLPRPLSHALGRLAQRAHGLWSRARCLGSPAGSWALHAVSFSPFVWYPTYAATAPFWNIVPLADLQVAGVIMWVPAGMVYFAAALTALPVAGVCLTRIGPSGCPPHNQVRRASTDKRDMTTTTPGSDRS